MNNQELRALYQIKSWFLIKTKDSHELPQNLQHDSAGF